MIFICCGRLNQRQEEAGYAAAFELRGEFWF